MLSNLWGQQITSPDKPAENYYQVDATITFTVVDMLSGGSVSGSLYIYDPNDPGVRLDTATIVSGTGSTTQKFHSGRTLGVQFNGTTTYFAYSWEITVPSASDPSLTAVSYSTPLKVLKKADYSADTEFDITKDTTPVWDGSAAVKNAFDPQNDEDPEMSVMFNNEDGNTGYGYPTLWKDYSTTTEGLQQRGCYAVIEFALNASGTSMSSVGDYLRFLETGGAIEKEWGTSIILIKRLDSEYLTGFNKDDSEGHTLDGLSGKGYFITIQFDFSGAIGNTDWNDEIVIRFSIMSQWGLDYALTHETLSQTGDTPYGWEGGHYGAADRLTIG